MFKEGTGELIRCSLKGKFKKEFNLKKDKLFHRDFASVGDFVQYDLNEDGTGVIHVIEERRNHLSRKSPKIRGASYRGERLEQIIAANIDYLFIVSSAANPPFNNKTIDRFIVTAESSGIEIKIILNKIDIADTEFINEWAALYEKIGYQVLLTSAKQNINMMEIKNLLKGKKSLFWGQSGVGKSSILNKIFPDFKLKVGEISNYTDRGIHTTVTSVMLEVDENSYIIDTPGVREIDPYGIKKEDLSHYFREFAEYNDDCRFNTCTHYHEPGCAVIEAVENGEISVERYDSYLRILETIEEDMNF